MATIMVKDAVVLIDDVDVAVFNGWKWHLHRSRHTTYIRGYPRGVKRHGTKLQYLHRVLVATPPGMVTDHANGNGLDNRRENLRICTGTQNGGNRHTVQSKTSPHKGVHWDAATGRWRAEVVHCGRRYRLGRFTNLDEAAAAYARKATELFGEFACAV